MIPILAALVVAGIPIAAYLAFCWGVRLGFERGLDVGMQQSERALLVRLASRQEPRRHEKRQEDPRWN